MPFACTTGGARRSNRSDESDLRHFRSCVTSPPHTGRNDLNVRPSRDSMRGERPRAIRAVPAGRSGFPPNGIMAGPGDAYAAGSRTHDPTAVPSHTPRQPRPQPPGHAPRTAARAERHPCRPEPRRHPAGRQRFAVPAAPALRGRAARQGPGRLRADAARRAACRTGRDGVRCRGAAFRDGHGVRPGHHTAGVHAADGRLSGDRSRPRALAAVRQWCTARGASSPTRPGDSGQRCG